METIYYSVSDNIEVISLEVIEGFSQTVSRCNITTPDYGGLGLGDTIEVDIGFNSRHGKVFTGIIQNINSERLPGQHVIEAADVLIRAVDHMIVSTDLEHPFSRHNIAIGDLVADLLEEAGIDNYYIQPSEYEYIIGVGEVPIEFQLVFAMDAINQAAGIIAWNCYADHDGVVRFDSTKPIPDQPDIMASAFYTTGMSGNLTVANRGISTDKLRNRVVVLGKPPITSEISDSSPYLPDGFYKTAVIATPLIDTQDMADTAAFYNLTVWNRLTEVANVEAIGDYARHARNTVNVVEDYTGTSGNWFVNDITHRLDRTYTIKMNLIR